MIEMCTLNMNDDIKTIITFRVLADKMFKHVPKEIKKKI